MVCYLTLGVGTQVRFHQHCEQRCRWTPGEAFQHEWLSRHPRSISSCSIKTNLAGSTGCVYGVESADREGSQEGDIP